MSIERDLHDLLYCHDCVIVPQWGGFLTHYRSARLDEARRVVHPPGKDISFNRNLDRNDGLLADQVAKREGIAFNEARGSIERAVAGWRKELDRNGRLELPHIGIFYRDAEKNLQFDPDRRSNFLKDAFGLRPVAAVPADRKEPLVFELPKKAASATLIDEETRTTHIWTAAAVAAVMFGAAAIWAYRMGGSPESQWSGLDPFRTTVQRTYEPADAPPEPIVKASGFTIPSEGTGIQHIDLPGSDRPSLAVHFSSPAPIEDPASVPVKRAAKAVKARFHVIGGCFAQEENADRFLQELKSKGYDAKRLPGHNKLHPVAFGSFATRSEALEALHNVKENNSTSAWLLVQ